MIQLREASCTALLKPALRLIAANKIYLKNCGNKIDKIARKKEILKNKFNKDLFPIEEF